MGRLAALAAIVGAALAVAWAMPVGQWMRDFVEGARKWGPLGPLVLALAYTPASVLFIPGSLLSLAAGALFGIVVGTIAVSLGSTLGAAVAFVLGRSLARPWVEGLVANDPRFRALDRAVAEQGWKIVVLTRLSPALPFSLLNYAFGLTRVRLREFVLASWVGMLPGTVFYVYLGSAAGSLADLAAGKAEGGVAQAVAFALGLVATIMVTVYVTRLARRALRAALLETSPTNDELVESRTTNEIP
jgi:uncharacterized membrane protein YdjX (TVP38/TMEM64 family)